MFSHFLIARLREPHDGLFTGQIDAVDTVNYSYRVTFDRPGLLNIILYPEVLDHRESSDLLSTIKCDLTSY